MAIPISTLETVYVFAFNTFINRDLQLIHSNAHEQSWSHRIASYMEHAANAACPGYHVDCEYNRNGDGLKQIRTLDGKVANITCDIILHSRGSIPEEDNLIAIEIKKSNRKLEHKNDDRERVKALTMSIDGEELYSYNGSMLPRYVCGYGMGIYLEYDVGSKKFIEEFYADGMLIAVCEFPLAERMIRASLRA